MNAPVDRLPPQNLEAEQSVLGSILLDRDAIATAIEHLRPEDFYQDVHQLIFRTVLKLYEENHAVDVVTLAEELRQQGVLDRVGGVTYLSTLARTVPTSANVRHYAEIVEAKAMLRNLIQAGTTIVGRAYDPTEDPEDLLDQAEQLIFDIGERRMLKPYSVLRVLLTRAFERLDKLYHTHAKVTGIPTGFDDFDEITSGLQPSDLIILAARPSQGKTTLAVNIAQNAAIRAKKAVGLFSLEMSADQLALRFLASEGRLDAHRLRTGNLEDSDFARLSTAMGSLAEARIFVDDTPNLSVLELRARARRMKRDQKVALIMVDYLQLMRGNFRTENRQQEIAEISRALKALARELEVPVLALSQLSRAVESSTDRRPQLSHLRESGAIEQDADVVAFIHFPPENSEYLETLNGVKVARDWQRRAVAWAPDLAEIIVAKQRNGPTGSVFLTFVRRYGRFDNTEIYRDAPPEGDDR